MLFSALKEWTRFQGGAHKDIVSEPILLTLMVNYGSLREAQILTNDHYPYNESKSNDHEYTDEAPRSVEFPSAFSCTTRPPTEKTSPKFPQRHCCACHEFFISVRSFFFIGFPKITAYERLVKLSEPMMLTNFCGSKCRWVSWAEATSQREQTIYPLKSHLT